MNAHMGVVVAAYTFDAGSNAFVFSEPPHTPLVNAVLAHFFPGKDSPPPKKRARVDKADADDTPGVGVSMAELEAKSQLKPMVAGTVARFYHAKVGGGPRVYSDASLSLLDTTTWLPK